MENRKLSVLLEQEGLPERVLEHLIPRWTSNLEPQLPDLNHTIMLNNFQWCGHPHVNWDAATHCSQSTHLLSAWATLSLLPPMLDQINCVT